MTPRFCSVLDTPIGAISIFADDQHICEITFNSIAAKPSSESELTILAANQINDYFNGQLREFNLPLGQEGTDFQKDVWLQLCKIPYAETITYAKFSAHKPLSIRAIAAANGKNKLAIVVPCHRVIGSNGKLVGYAGGLWRKQWLLQHEREIACKGQTVLSFN